MKKRKIEKWERTYDVYAAVLTHLVKKKLNSSGVIADIDQRGKHGKQTRIEESVIEDLKLFVVKLLKNTLHRGCEISANVLTLTSVLTKGLAFERILIR